MTSGLWEPNGGTPKTISQLMRDHKLSYPFIVQKISFDKAGEWIVLPVYTYVTITNKCSPTIADPSNNVYFGYIDNQSYQLHDSPVWKLHEASDNNVLSLNHYKKFRDQVKKRKK